MDQKTRRESTKWYNQPLRDLREMKGYVHCEMTTVYKTRFLRLYLFKEKTHATTFKVGLTNERKTVYNNFLL